MTVNEGGKKRKRYDERMMLIKRREGHTTK